MAEAREGGVACTSADEYYWLGYAVGNGCTGHGRPALAVTIGNRKLRYGQEEKAAQLMAWLREIGYAPYLVRPRGKACVNVCLERESFKQRWLALGYHWGALAPDKTVPDSIWTADLAGRKAFLRGLLDADGTVGADTIGGDGAASLHMCQRPLLAEVQILLRSCGVLSTLHGPFHSAPEFTSWRLDLNKGQAVSALGYGIAAKVCVRAPAPQFLVKRFVEATQGPLPYATGTSNQVLMSRMRVGGTTNVYKLQELCRELGIDVGPIYDTTPLVSACTLDRVEDTYTLAVEDPLHRFDAEGVIAKNTASEITKLAMLAIYQDGYITQTGTRMLIQVHDEIVFKIPLAYQGDQQLYRAISDHMSNAVVRVLGYPLKVALDTSGAEGTTWLACK